jgi:hypothetical protein
MNKHNDYSGTRGQLSAEALPAHHHGELRRDGLRQPRRPHPLRPKPAGQDTNSPGSLGIAISEAVEAAASSGGAKKYSLGSVLGHVLMHQTVVGQETLQQMELAGEYPDFVIGCAGGARFATSPASPTRSCTRT